MSGGPGAAAALRSPPRGGGGGAAGAVGRGDSGSAGRGAPLAWVSGGTGRRSAPAPPTARSPLQAASRAAPAGLPSGSRAVGSGHWPGKVLGSLVGWGLRRRLGEPYGGATLRSKVGAFAFSLELSPLSRRDQVVHLLRLPRGFGCRPRRC